MGALGTGRSEEACDDALVMTDHPAAERAGGQLKKGTTSLHDAHLKMISASWGIIWSPIPPPKSPRRESNTKVQTFDGNNTRRCCDTGASL